MALPFTDVSRYLTEVTPARDEVLTEMENYARENRFPIVGPTSGSFLHQMVLLTSPKRIFEMGSGFGSATENSAKNSLAPCGRKRGPRRASGVGR